MPNFSARPLGAGAAFGVNTDPTLAASALLPLGTPVETRSGLMFRWCKAGAADLVAGNVIQSAAFLVNHTAMAVTATSIGATSMVVTPGATAGAANLYAEGFAGVSVTPGLGQTFQVSSHAAITSSVAFTLNLMPSDPVLVALTTSSKIDLYAHPYQNVIQAPITTLTGKVVGVAPYVITAAFNGWLQTVGPCATLNKGTEGAGLQVGSPGTVAGGVVIFAAATTSYVGDIMGTGVDAVASMVYLRIG